MTQFVQLHLLASYPPSNPNRDDLGSPKTALMGGHKRLRMSSQSLKRAWRTSDAFKCALAGHIGTRTKVKGVAIYEALVEAGISEKQAKEWAQAIAGEFGKLKAANRNQPKEDLEIEQLAHFSPEELQAIDELVMTLIKEKRAPNSNELKLLRRNHSAVDLALFGRMLASSPGFNVEAAVQVAHAITVHKVELEDDYFTAVDDLNRGGADAGAAHIGEAEFAAGLFYLYLCINCDLLVENLGGNRELAAKALAALAEAAATIAPSGKQNSFANRVRASYILAERGSQQPRSLAVAFLKPVSGNDILESAINALALARLNMNQVYGACSDSEKEANAHIGSGSLKEVLALSMAACHA